MNLSKNLIVALLGLGCYARCNNINLANNTSIILIILALLARQNINDDTENGENNIESTRTRTTISYQNQGNNGTCNNCQGYTVTTPNVPNMYPQPLIYAMPNYPCNRSYPYGYTYNHCPNNCQTTTYANPTLMPYNYGTPFSTSCSNCACNNCNHTVY